MRKSVKFAVLHSLIQAFIVGIFMDYAAWQHNPQNTIHSGNGYVDISYLITIFASWFFPCLSASAIIYFCVFIVCNKYAKLQKYGMLKGAAINSLLYLFIQAIISIVYMSCYFNPEFFISAFIFFASSFAGFAIFLGVLLAIKFRASYHCTIQL
jgi:hypothetical protein